jgi:hypothetical protein
MAVIYNQPELFVVPVNAWKKGTYSGDEGSTTPSCAKNVRSSGIALCSTIFPSSPIRILI